MHPKNTDPTLATAIHDPGAQYLDHFLHSVPILRRRFGALVCNLSLESDPGCASHLSRAGIPYKTAHANLDHIGYHRYASLCLCPPSRPALYADPDHILRWLTKDSEEFDTVLANHDLDCLIIGRTPVGIDASPRRLRETENIANSLFQVTTGINANLMMACRRFSPHAVQVIVANSEESSIGNDVEWPLLCYQAQLSIGACAGQGLIYKTVDSWVDHKPDSLDRDLDAWLVRTRFLQQHVAVFERRLRS